MLKMVDGSVNRSVCPEAEGSELRWRMMRGIHDIYAEVPIAEC